MKGAMWAAVLAAVIAGPNLLAVKIGESYKDVLAELGTPTGRVVLGDVTVLQYPAVTVKLRNEAVISVKTVARTPESLLPPPMPPAVAAPVPDAAQVTAERVMKLVQDIRETAAQVREVVNQPVTQVPVDGAMSLGKFQNGWYQGRPPPPDFDNADVRTTQSTAPYEKHDYGTSPLKPEVAFKMDELAFNAQLAFFYVDPTVPKKKLSQDELERINNLYREIGNDITVLKAMGVKDPENVLVPSRAQGN